MRHERVVYLRRRHDGSHRDGTIRDLFGEIENIGCDAKRFSSGVSTTATESCDHLVKNQQDVVLIAQLPQALQITYWWRNDARRPRHGLNNNGSNRRGIM